MLSLRTIDFIPASEGFLPAWTSPSFEEVDILPNLIQRVKPENEGFFGLFAD